MFNRCGISHQDHGFDGARDGSVKKRPVQQSASSDRDDHPPEGRTLRLVDADGSSGRHFFEVSRSDEVFGAIVKHQSGPFGFRLVDDAQGAIHKAGKDGLTSGGFGNRLTFGVELRSFHVVVLQPQNLRAQPEAPVVDGCLIGHVFFVDRRARCRQPLKHSKCLGHGSLVKLFTQRP